MNLDSHKRQTIVENIRNTVFIIGIFVVLFSILQFKIERPQYRLDDILGHQVVARIAIAKSIKEALTLNETTTWSNKKMKLHVRIKPHRIIEHNGETCGHYHIRIRLENKIKSWQDKTCKKPNQPW